MRQKMNSKLFSLQVHVIITHLTTNGLFSPLTLFIRSFKSNLNVISMNQMYTIDCWSSQGKSYKS